MLSLNDTLRDQSDDELRAARVRSRRPRILSSKQSDDGDERSREEAGRQARCEDAVRVPPHIHLTNPLRRSHEEDAVVNVRNLFVRIHGP